MKDSSSLLELSFTGIEEFYGHQKITSLIMRVPNTTSAYFLGLLKEKYFRAKRI